MKLLLYSFLVVIISASVMAATGTPDESRNADLGAMIEEQGEECRTYMEEFGKETDQQFAVQKQATLKAIDYELRKFKFTLAITIVAAQSAALWLYHLIVKRKDRHYKKITKAFAEAAQRRNDGKQHR